MTRVLTFALLSVAVTLFSTAAAQSHPDSQTLRSAAVTLHTSGFGQGISVQGQVQVLDSAGVFVSNAAVSAVWHKPYGVTVSQTAVTNGSGVATFNTSNGRGTYTLTVTNIVRPDYTFDAGGSVLSGSVTTR